MDTGTLVLILVVALVVVVLLLLIRAATAGRRGRPTLRPLAAESRERYVNEWDDIETKFVDAPEQAVREAESLVMSVLRERGHPLTDRDLPPEMVRARRLSRSRDRTEGLRQALLHYRAVMERMVGTQDDTRDRDLRRREMA